MASKAPEKVIYKTKKCQCCKARYGDYQVHYDNNSNYAFCEECYDHHKISPKTSRDEHHKTRLIHDQNPPLPDTKPPTISCYCCGIHYNEKDGESISFECKEEKHEFWFCDNCSEKRNYCPEGDKTDRYYF